MKKIFVCLCLLLTLCGCGSGYERSTEMATLNNISFDDFVAKKDNDESFMVMITYEECTSCEFFIENVLSGYIRNHGFELNRVHFLKEDWDSVKDKLKNFIIENPYSEEELKSVNAFDDYEEGSLLTPTLYFIENGEIKDKLIGGKITADELDAMIVKYRLDEVK